MLLVVSDLNVLGQLERMQERYALMGMVPVWGWYSIVAR
ncbi:hypothetical protein FIU95_07335 [Microbulbifer sp. THAF38]|nr:hypothetical protein FIU95_07335 [Microbulbifer sp. THAF38]